MKILFFSPYSLIWPDVVQENQLTVILRKLGHEVKSIHCNKFFAKLCHMHESAGLEVNSPLSQKDNLCKSCIQNANLYLGKTNEKKINLSNFRYSKDSEKVKSFISELENSNLELVQFQGITVGKFVLSEIILRHKKRSVILSEDEFQLFKEILENCVSLVLASQNLLELHKPDIVMSYNPQYAMQSTFLAVAKSHSIRTLLLDGGPAINKLGTHTIIWDFAVHGYRNPAKQIWMLNSINPTKNEIELINNYYREVKDAKLAWVYSSSPKGLSTREFFQVPKTSKLFLLAMNSYDEVLGSGLLDEKFKKSHESIVFRNQIEWIKFTIEYFRRTPNSFLIIRPHPRELPNKREGKTAESVRDWMALSKNLPDNVVFDTPDLGFSIYDHFDEIDILLTGWSSTSLDALYHDIPVITYDAELLGYPSSLVITGRSIREYESNLYESMSKELKVNNREVLEWLVFYFFRGNIELGGGIKSRKPLSWFGKSSFFMRLITKLIPIPLQKLDLILSPKTKRHDKLNELLYGVRTNLYS